ncbi:hypothetical protein COL84_28770, partial [Bacillus pseudomycoides]
PHAHQLRETSYPQNDENESYYYKNHKVLRFGMQKNLKFIEIGQELFKKIKPCLSKQGFIISNNICLLSK